MHEGTVPGSGELPGRIPCFPLSYHHFDFGGIFDAIKENFERYVFFTYFIICFKILYIWEMGLWELERLELQWLLKTISSTGTYLTKGNLAIDKFQEEHCMPY